MHKSSRLEEQLKKSEKLMSDFKKKLKAVVPKDTPKKEDLAEANRELKEQIEKQRKEFETLVGKLKLEIEAAQAERKELTNLLRLSYQALSGKGAGFEDEPTAAYTRDMENVIEKEKGAAEQFAEEEATESFSVDKIMKKKVEEE
jgi:hypothetical protein